MNSDSDPKPQDERDEDARHHGHFRIGAVILALCLIGLVALAWYTYPELKRHSVTLTAMPRMQQLVDGMGDRFRELDSKIAEWASDKQALGDRMTGMGHRLETRIEALRQQVENASAETMRRVEAEIGSHVQAVETRLGKLESARDDDQTRAANLERELDQVRSEMMKQAEKQADELNAVRRDMEDAGAKHEQQLATLKEGAEREQRDVASIEQKLAVRRVDFEVTRNHSTELAEGISLGVTSMDPLYRKVSGWMWIMPDRRTIWLKGQGAQEPVTFYGFKDGKKREVVFTNVAANSVTGYLLLPADTSEPSPARSGE
jgi:multidrug efflux pump subunit AcrA (membrane-fusion protein)